MNQELAVSKPLKPVSFKALIVLVVLSIIFWDAPFASWILAPVKIFVTTLHELGHAMACIATGGTVNGLTIVADNDGHGGLTMCMGGNPFIYAQAGYLGTAFFGCVFILLGRFPGLAKAVLVAMGLFIGFATVCFMSGTIFREGRLLEGFMSMCWGLILGVALVWSGIKLKPQTANLLLLFLAVQTALNSLTDVGVLLRLSMGLIPASSFSDATNMQSMTGIPAWFWSILWALISVLMLSGTLWLAYGRPFARRKA